MNIREALRARYPMPEYVLMEEVANSTGGPARRAADAVAVSLWPSRGLNITGFEIKTARNDWLRELKEPAKAEEIAQYCDYWFMVTTPDIIKPGELPAGWGHMEWSGARWKFVAPAPRRENITPLSRGFVAAMMRRAGEIDERVIRERVEQQTSDVRKQEAKRAEEAIARATAKHNELRESLEKVKAKTGIDLTSYYFDENVIDAIKYAMTTGITDRYGPMRNLRSSMKNAMELLDKALPAESA